MFRKFSISLLIAVTALLVFAVAVSAQGRWNGAGPNQDGMRAGQMQSWRLQNGDETTQPYVNRFNDGECANFVDEDGDGVCDNAGTGAAFGPTGQRGMNRGPRSGMAMGATGEPFHRFGDGTCDFGTPPRDGTGNQFGQ